MSKLIFSSSITLLRNYDDVLFDTPECEEDANKINQRCLNAIGGQAGWTMCSPRMMASDDKRRLVRIRHSFIKMPNDTEDITSAVFMNEAEQSVVETNKHDHFTISSFSHGEALKSEAMRCVDISKALCLCGNYAFSAQLGFLTRDLQHIGCGMVASCLMHLPSLYAGHGINKLRGSLQSAGLDIVPAENFPATFSLWSVHNVTCVGIDENTIVDNILGAVVQLECAEKEASADFAKKNPDKIEDAAVRAVALMRSARLIGGAWEMGEWWSAARRACENGIECGISTEKLDEIAEGFMQETAVFASERELAEFVRGKMEG